MTLYTVFDGADGPLASFYEHPQTGLAVGLDAGLIRLLESRRLFANVRWQEYVPDDQADRTDVDSLDTAEAAASRSRNGDRHAIMFDIDHPATLENGILVVDTPRGPFRWVPPTSRVWLVDSTNPGHHHLYVDVAWDWRTVLITLQRFANAGAVEQGYLQVSEKREFTALRLPWIKKETAPDELVEAIMRAGDPF